MNRQSWTNQKRFKSGGQEEGGGDCNLCGETENTHHLLFECEEFAEIFWAQLGEILTEVEGKRVELHMFNVIYNVKIKASEGVQEAAFQLVQEGKRTLIKKRFDRCQNRNLQNIIIDERRALAYWSLIVKSKISLMKYSGKEHDTYIRILGKIIDKI